MVKKFMIIAISIIFTLLSTTSVLLAANKLPPKASTGTPFEELWNAVNENTDKITTNTINIATSSTDIANMAAAVAANASAIADNAAAIAANQASIGVLQDQINDLQGQLSDIQQLPASQDPPEPDGSDKPTISGKRIYTGFAALHVSGWWPYQQYRSDWIEVPFDDLNYIVITNNSYTVVKRAGSFQLIFVSQHSLNTRGGDWLAIGE